MAFFRRNQTVLVTLAVLAVLLVLMASRYEPKVAASILLSGLTLGSLYFLVASGLSLIFGLMDVLNFAQGLLFMMGAYIGYTMYANPRMLLNTLPLFLGLLGGAMIGAALARWLWRRLGTLSNSIERGLTIGLWVAAIAALVIGVNDFDLISLAASSVTVAGGAISTVQAQGADSIFIGRMVALLLAGVFFGAASYSGRNRHAIGRADPRRQRRDLIMAIVFIVIAIALTPLRLGAERISAALMVRCAFLAGAGGGRIERCGAGRVD